MGNRSKHQHGGSCSPLPSAVKLRRRLELDKHHIQQVAMEPPRGGIKGRSTGAKIAPTPDSSMCVKVDVYEDNRAQRLHIYPVVGDGQTTQEVRAQLILQLRRLPIFRSR